MLISDNQRRDLSALWLTEHYPPGRGGMAQSCDRIVHALRALGATVDVVHFAHRGPRPAVEAQRGGRYIACPPGSDPAHAMNRLWNALSADPKREETTHVVAFGGTLPLLSGPVFAAWLGVPLVTMIRGDDFDVAVFTPRRGEVLREALERSARVCVVSRDKLHKITSLYPRVRTVWIPNGIDLSEWQPLPSELEKAANWRLQTVKPGRRVLGVFGHLKPKKGILFFLESLLRSGRSDRFHLLLVGEADQETIGWLESHQEAIDFSHYPFMERYGLLSWYPACDLVAIPSFYDGMPNVLLEAAALGIPFLASTAGGMADLLVEGRHGLLFRPGDPHGCRRAIALAARIPAEDLRRMGQECRFMAGGLSHQLEAERYLGVLLETLQRRGAACRAIAVSPGLSTEADLPT